MANSVNKQVSVNDVKQAKAVQQVTTEQAFNLLREIRKEIKSFGGLREIMKLTRNFAYSLSETKVNETDVPVIKVGRKSFYLSQVGAVNETNVLNVVKSVLKVEDAKRVYAKKLAKRLSFDEFCETQECKNKIQLLQQGAVIVGSELTDQQVKTAKHRLYDEYLKSLGLGE